MDLLRLDNHTKLMCRGKQQNHNCMILIGKPFIGIMFTKFTTAKNREKFEPTNTYCQ